MHPLRADGIGRVDHRGQLVGDREYGRSPAQENLEVFDFDLEDEHMEAFESLHDGMRVLHDLLIFTGT